MIRSTYRLQFHRDYSFAEAESIIPYLERLGISHIHASPITRARAGSTQGRDVVDPTEVDPDLGGDSGLRWLTAALQSRNMGVVVDIFPGHVYVASGENAWWNDVVERGRSSRYARYFDIDWDRRLVLPLLSAPLSQALANGEVRVEDAGGELMLAVGGGARLPVSLGGLPGTTFRHQILNDLDPGEPEGLANLRALIDRQSYQLVPWTMAGDLLNWRRSLGSSDFAALRIEDEEVFEATHALYFRLYAEGLIKGVNIGDLDGLADPEGYCRMLRARFDSIRPGAMIVAEKMLTANEAFPTGWGADGTAGHDAMDAIGAVLHDPAGAAPLKRLWQSVSGRTSDFDQEAVGARCDILAFRFGSEFERCCAAFEALINTTPAGEATTPGMIGRNIERLLWVFPARRTYGTGGEAPVADATLREAAWRAAQPHLPPGEAHVTQMILAWLAGEGPGDRGLAAEAVQAFQLLTARLAAEAVAGTAACRYGVLLSRNETGSDPAHIAMPIETFHATMEKRARDFPTALSTTATHDQMWGEDARARLAVLSEMPSEWASTVERLFRLAQPHSAGIHSSDLYILFQALVAAWPDENDPEGLSQLAGQIGEWQIAMLREAGLRTSWEMPEESYEQRYRALGQALLDSAQSPEFLEDMLAFLRRIAAPAQANMTAQVTLRHLVPGICDMPQGTELLDLGLGLSGDRGPVDFTMRQELLSGPASHGTFKIKLIADLLQLRKRHDTLFIEGDYRPLPVEGPRAQHVIAFARAAAGQELLCAVQVRCAAALAGTTALVPSAEWWGDTEIVAPTGRYSAVDCFMDMPAFIQVR